MKTIRTVIDSFPRIDLLLAISLGITILGFIILQFIL